jgi:hypothetical protein
MYKTWHTKAARIPHSEWATDDYITDGGPTYLHDYGACTVTQLLLGYDPNLSEKNYNGRYKNDGLNPCFQSNNYYNYAQYDRETPQKQKQNGGGWDYVVMNDQSMRPAILHKRNGSIAALQKHYAPLFLEMTPRPPIPVLYNTYGYWRTQTINMTQALDPYGNDSVAVTDVPTFTARLYRGYQLYAQALLDMGIPQVRIAPVGLAFLTIWEENYSFWKRLFLVDEFHPSPLGTYLIGCILYSTIFEGQQPPPSTTDKSIQALFGQTRRLQRLGNDISLPTVDETLYLRYIAKRVTLLGHVPKHMKFYKNKEEEMYDKVD